RCGTTSIRCRRAARGGSPRRCGPRGVLLSRNDDARGALLRSSWQATGEAVIAERNTTIASKLISAAAFAGGLVGIAPLPACSGGGAALSGGLTARMDQPGASLNRAEALSLLNSYRSTQNAPALAADPALDATAQQLVVEYARSGQLPKLPAGAVGIRVSAG